MGSGFAEKMAFPPESRRGNATGVAQPLHGHEVMFDCVTLNTQLHMLCYGSETPQHLVIYIHGNCEDIYRIDEFMNRCYE